MELIVRDREGQIKYRKLSIRHIRPAQTPVVDRRVPASHGGHTVVCVDGKMEVAHCNTSDAYNKRLGVYVALQKLYKDSIIDIHHFNNQVSILLD